MGGVPLLFIILLSMFGYAYAHWSDTITITGTAKMGSLTIVWDEKEGGFLDYTDNEVDKDVAWGKIYYDPDSYVVDPHTGKGGYEILIINIYNAYPCYEIHFTTLKVNNTGTIPAHFIGITITGYDETDGKELVFEWLPGYEYKKGAFKDDVDGDGELEEIINVEIVDFVCHQLDPCDTTKGEIDFHFKQEAEECHTYTFTVTIEAVQWNKVGGGEGVGG